jgi:hypothetical protein
LFTNFLTMSDKREMWVEGTVTIKVYLEVEATSENEAIHLAKENLIADYNLGVHGYSHDVNGGFEIKLDAGDFDED